MCSIKLNVQLGMSGTGFPFCHWNVWGIALVVGAFVLRHFRRQKSNPSVRDGVVDPNLLWQHRRRSNPSVLDGAVDPNCWHRRRRTLWTSALREAGWIPELMDLVEGYLAIYVREVDD